LDEIRLLRAELITYDVVRTGWFYAPIQLSVKATPSLTIIASPPYTGYQYDSYNSSFDNPPVAGADPVREKILSFKPAFDTTWNMWTQAEHRLFLSHAFATNCLPP